MSKHEMVTSKMMRKIAEARLHLVALNKDTPESIAAHTRFTIKLVNQVLNDPVFQDLYELYRRGEMHLWADLLADQEEDISKLVAQLGYDAVIRLRALIHSEDEKVANSAIRTALEYNPDLDRPVVRHEIVNRFTTEELDKAREVVRKLRKSAQPNGDPLAN